MFITNPACAVLIKVSSTQPLHPIHVQTFEFDLALPSWESKAFISLLPDLVCLPASDV